VTYLHGIFITFILAPILVNTNGCEGSSSVTSSTQQSAPSYQKNIKATSTWLSSQTLSDGAILYSSTEIDPYFSNLAAIGWLSDTNQISAVEAWVQWYIVHLNSSDYNGLNSTIYTYTVKNGAETSTGVYDSADSYAATFLSLTEALWNTNDQGAQTLIKNIGEQKFERIAKVIIGLQQSNGLVYAKPDYQIEYLMDNSEDYRGLSDFAFLATQAWNDTAATTKYAAYAAKIQAGIQSVLYNSSTGLYYPYAGSATPNLGTWYPDSVAQLFPITNGVIATTSAQAESVYNKFNTAWPGWPQLSYNSQTSFSWCVVGYVSYLMEDTLRTNAYLLSIQDQYVDTFVQFAWPFYSAEAGWFLRTNAAMAESHFSM
jgi:hypothetical protein